MRATTGGGIAAVAIAIVGVAASLAYATAPSGAGRTSTTLAGITGLHEVIGKQQYSTTPRKQGFAKCPRGEIVVGGGYILAGAFQTVNSPAPRSLPVVTESTPATRNDLGAGPDTWSVVAIAPSSLGGPWGLTPKAMCAKAR